MGTLKGNNIYVMITKFLLHKTSVYYLKWALGFCLANLLKIDLYIEDKPPSSDVNMYRM